MCVSLVFYPAYSEMNKLSSFLFLIYFKFGRSARESRDLLFYCDFAQGNRSDSEKSCTFTPETIRKRDMINRILIRTKVVQIVYSCLIDEDKSLELAEKELFASLEKSYELYHLLLLIPVELTRLQAQRLDAGRSKFLATEAEKYPNTRLVDNRFVALLEKNQALDKILDSEWYAEYLAADDSFENDRTFWKNIYKQLIFPDENLGELLEAQSLYWNDDMPIISTFVLKTVKRFDEKSDADQELLPMFKDEDDRDFARTLFRRSMLNYEGNRSMIERFTRNWEIDRIAFMDIVVMVVALAEITEFPSIPLQVSLNEYIEIAKSYSTPKSGNFINGVLDAVITLLKKEGKLTK